jgi:aspartyl-tRNA(Asn)/glutamyl-tRNA(Gln) amidotransferase subunit B
VDVNRSGVPLMEIVSEPDIRSPEEARQYLIKLRTILQYLEVSTGSMEEGSFRCDANISLRPVGTTEFLPKVEVKNMNSFRSVFRALSYEMERQAKMLDEGKLPEQETRGWVEARGVTVSQRSKEFAHDYRYFPEPDLPPLSFSREEVEELRNRLPELPDARRERFMADYGLSRYDASLLTATKANADFFEECLPVKDGTKSSTETSLQERAKTVSNWMLGDLARLLNATNREIEQIELTPSHLVEMLDLIDGGTLSGPAAKEVFEEMFNTGKQAKDIIAEKGLTQISDDSELEPVVHQVLEDNPQAVSDYRAGKKQALKFLLGQVMRQTRGRANPALANQVLVEQLKDA